MEKTLIKALNEVCLSLADCEQGQSHGTPVFKVRGKTFAQYCLNHHGDGRVALWVAAPSGAQDTLCANEPSIYFVPPYTGHRGWLGIELNKGLAWQQVVGHLYEAYRLAAPKELGENLVAKAAHTFTPPTEVFTPEKINPFLRPAIQRKLQRMESLCAALPETSQHTHFGNPVWKAGKKTFVCAHHYNERLGFQFWVGADQQSFLTADERFTIPPYTGGNGWIDLRADKTVDWAEIEMLLMGSYRHFALKRMLKALDD